MSIRDHKEEVKRWLNSQNGTKVWEYNATRRTWELTDNPEWLNDNVYIVNDKHAEIRKEWIDRGKPPIEHKDFSSEWTLTDKPTWDTYLEYRIKPSEWETPGCEDPIAYHAKRIDTNWEADWFNDNQAKWYITYHHKTGKYYYHCNYHSKVLNATYMSKSAAEQIVEALNSRKLKLKDT